MREIKFRVFWEHPESDSSGFDYFKAGERMDEGDGCQIFHEIEQFTGLHDKNGKEIYEGDQLVHVDRPRDKATVLFKNGCFICGSIRISTYHSSVIEVIGTIHD